MKLFVGIAQIFGPLAPCIPARWANGKVVESGLTLTDDKQLYLWFEMLGANMQVDKMLLEWAEYWYQISWKGVLAGGVITAIGAIATIVFLLLQWRTTGIREEHSDWRTSSLELQTAQAKADLGFAQADIAKANVAIAEATARAAEANQKAEEERLARVKLEAKIAPRTITQIQQRDLAAALTNFKNERGTLVASPSTPESEWLVRILGAPLLEAGWNIEILPGTATATVLFPKGVIVYYAVDGSKPVIFPERTDRAKAAIALVEKLNDYGIEATAIASPMISPPRTIEITISSK